MTMRERLKPFGYGVLGVVCGAAVLAVAYHLYTDHVSHHQMIQWINTYGPRLVQTLPVPK